MVHQFFILLFLTGVTPLTQSVYRKYYLIQKAKTWSDAQAYCRSTHTDLATIETANDVVKLQKEAQKYQFSSRAWIGLWNDVNSWCWSFDNKPLNWSDWTAATSQPDNIGGREECAGTTTKDSNSETFSRNIFYNVMMTWTEAQTYCRRHHTDLANPRDPIENEAIKLGLTIHSLENVWIGLSRDSWKWSDQNNFSTVTWIPRQPDNSAGNENCGYISNGQAGDAPCSQKFSFFCERVITGQQQIVRVKVQSDQDVNDPTVMAAISQQINQKLKDRGMENIRMKWRERPGGAVFHKIKNNTTTAQNATSESCNVKSSR